MSNSRLATQECAQNSDLFSNATFLSVAKHWIATNYWICSSELQKPTPFTTSNFALKHQTVKCFCNNQIYNNNKKSFKLQYNVATRIKSWVVDKSWVLHTKNRLYPSHILHVICPKISNPKMFLQQSTTMKEKLQTTILSSKNQKLGSC